jgi:hypothetical protein
VDIEPSEEATPEISFHALVELHIHNLSGYWEGQKQRIDSAH